MDTGETYRFQGAELKQEVKLLTIACRFVPYDQWLVTHVDSSWKINQVKSWILAKCVANSSSRSRPTPIFNLPLIHPPAKPKTKLSKRPASPIIFADFPLSSEGPSHSPGYHSDGQSKEDKAKRKKRRGRGRPISPITFAPIGVDLQDDSEEGSVTGKDEGEVIGMGYEEDDEWDSPEDGSDIDELELDPNPRVGRRANRNQYLGYYDRPSADQPTIRPPSATPRIIHSKNLVNPASLPRGSYTTYHPDLLNLIRFSTGQILERHCSLSDYEIKPYELLEVHRWGVVTRLPREITFKYIEPYWEGWVKALRLVFREPRVVIEARSQDREGPGRLKEASMNEMDGGYRETARKTMEVLAGGKVAPFSAADVALGLRPAPSSRGKSVKKSKRLGGNDLDIHTSVLKSSKLSNSSHYDASQSPTASTSKSGLTQSTSNNNNGYRSKGKGGKLEWRERWLFIKDGVLHLKKENSELSSTTTQILPLDSLTEIRNADQLGRTAPPSPSQWIVCAKFKTPITTTRAAVPESHNTTTYARQTSHSNITSNPMPYSTLKSPVNLPKPSSLSRGGSISHRGDSKHSTSAGYRASNVGPGRSTTSSSSTSKPKIMLQIKPLPPPAPTRIIPDTETSSSMVIAPKEKDKGKMAIASLSSSRLQSTSEQKIISDPEVFSGSGSENPSEAHTEEEDASSENETDTADLAEGKGKQRVTVASAINNRKHPQISIESDADLDGSGSTLSSPVFAHTEDDSPFSDGPARSYGYGYGHIGGTSEWRRKGGGAQEKNTAPALKRGGAGYEEEGENAEKVLARFMARMRNQLCPRGDPVTVVKNLILNPSGLSWTLGMISLSNHFFVLSTVTHLMWLTPVFYRLLFRCQNLLTTRFLLHPLRRQPSHHRSLALNKRALLCLDNGHGTLCNRNRSNQRRYPISLLLTRSTQIQVLLWSLSRLLPKRLRISILQV
ncbi:hypothetical protein F5050DRAFT_357264 [Lentinula boryana]|uniref:PH domain-containing protein n=1 Tax=Lentinula boryana TaxID=40481 RepID=A0ABQ8Q9B7_9AGAR|nr:hypothetical protein F5050DRAFT_357264 [Lentinula boryana]